MDKRLLLASAFGLFFIAGAIVPAFAAKVDDRTTKCSIATLEGSYIYTGHRVIWTKSRTPRPESCPSTEKDGLYSSTRGPMSERN